MNEFTIGARDEFSNPRDEGGEVVEGGGVGILLLGPPTPPQP